MEGLEQENDPEKRPGFRRWLKRLGLAGVLFFLIKGLIWLAIFAGIGSLTNC